MLCQYRSWWQGIISRRDGGSSGDSSLSAAERLKALSGKLRSGPANIALTTWTTIRALPPPTTTVHSTLTGGCNHVDALARKLRHEAAMAAEVDDAAVGVVLQRGRIQIPRSQVRLPAIERSRAAEKLCVLSRACVLTFVCSRADDLIPEENPVVLQAIKRLPPKEAYDRVFRMRRAFQVGIKYQELKGKN